MSIVGAWSNSVTVTASTPPVFGPNPYYEKLAGLGFSWALRSISNGIWYDHFGNHNGILLGNPTVIDNPTDLNNLGFPTNLETVVSTDGLNDYVRVLHHDDLEPSNQITLAWWTQINGTQSSAWSSHFSKGNNSAWELRRNASNSPTNSLRFDVRGGTGGDINATILGMPTETRLHLTRLIVATYDGSGEGAMKIWVSSDTGVMTEVVSADRSGTIGSDPTSDLLIFAQDNAGVVGNLLAAHGAAPSLAPVAITLNQAQELYDAAFISTNSGKIIERWDGSGWVPQQLEQWDGTDWQSKIIDDA